jgi:hypothetical protein
MSSRALLLGRVRANQGTRGTLQMSRLSGRNIGFWGVRQTGVVEKGACRQPLKVKGEVSVRLQCIGTGRSHFSLILGAQQASFGLCSLLVLSGSLVAQLCGLGRHARFSLFPQALATQGLRRQLLGLRLNSIHLSLRGSTANFPFV